MPKKYASMGERLLANSVIPPVDSPDYHEHAGSPCWIWIGRVSYRGYPQINVRKDGKHERLYAHRLSIVELGGRRLRSDHIGKHLCNNTVCISPHHLAGGTQSTNMQQCVRDGRHNSQRGGA